MEPSVIPQPCRRKVIRLLTYAAAVILLFDLVASILSQLLPIRYALFSIGSFAIYFLVGLLVARAAGLKLGVVAAATTGLVEATLGWAISWLVGPGRFPLEAVRPAEIVATVIMVILAPVVLGLVGALIGQLLKRRAPAAGEA